MSPVLDSPVRVALVDDYEIIVEGLGTLLAPFTSQVAVVEKALATSDVRAEAERADADVVLVDIRLKDADGVELLHRLLAGSPAYKVIVFTDDDGEQSLFQALRDGASGYLLKSASGIELVDAITKVHRGEVIINSALAARVVLAAAHLRRGQHWPGIHLGLSGRESEVLVLLAEGLNNRTIAERLIIGEETVKTHLRAVYRKLGVKDRSQAISVALRENIVP